MRDFCIDKTAYVDIVKEIKFNKKDMGNTNSLFDDVFESDYIVIPDLEMIKIYARENWRLEKDTPLPTYFKKGERKKIKIVSLKNKVMSETASNQAIMLGYIFPSIVGLALGEMAFKDLLPKEVDILGIDLATNSLRVKNKKYTPSMMVRYIPDEFLMLPGDNYRVFCDKYEDWDLFPEKTHLLFFCD